MAVICSKEEVAKHNSPSDCWVVLYGQVYDLTPFLPQHPGGSRSILALAGQDATIEYDAIHPPGTLEEHLPAEARIGNIDPKSVPRQTKELRQPLVAENDPRIYRLEQIEDCLNLDDIEALATRRLSRKAWAYYYSASNDSLTKSRNTTVYQKVLLRPRVLINVTRCDTSTGFLDRRCQARVPFYVAPAAMARLAHTAGEAGIAQACKRYGVLQIISNNASQTPEQIVAGNLSEHRSDTGSRDDEPEQVFGWQLYVQTERRKSEAMLRRVARLPNIKFICLTVDAAVPGKRELDERQNDTGNPLPVESASQPDVSARVASNSVSEAASTTVGKGDGGSGGRGGIGRFLFHGTAADLTWETTLPWLAKHTSLPIVIKGIQTHEDAYLASMYSPQVKAIILSNHGGRALDTAPPPLLTLLEIRKHFPDVLSRLEIWVDGGVKRGTDVVKALCLGATMVGIGRAPLFGLGAGGIKGVERVFEILRAEVATAMRLLGVQEVNQLGMQHVNMRFLERELYDGSSELQTPHSTVTNPRAKL